MASKLIDLHNHVLKYGDTEIIIIFDDDGNAWFQAIKVELYF